MAMFPWHCQLLIACCIRPQSTANNFSPISICSVKAELSDSRKTCISGSRGLHLFISFLKSPPSSSSDQSFGKHEKTLTYVIYQSLLLFFLWLRLFARWSVRSNSLAAKTSNGRITPSTFNSPFQLSFIAALPVWVTRSDLTAVVLSLTSSRSC